MPQSERSATIKEFLWWLRAKSRRKGATMAECINILEKEICEMGATKKRCRSYVESCARVGFISLSPDRLRFTVTSEGENWLKRKV